MSVNFHGLDSLSHFQKTFEATESSRHAKKTGTFKNKLDQAIKTGYQIDEKVEQKKDKEADNMELMEACKKFEAFFLHQMMNSMRDTIHRSDLFGDSHEREIYEGMLDEAITEEAAESGGIGLAEKIYNQYKSE